MRKLRSQARKVNLLFALELLDAEARQHTTDYVGSLTEQAVLEAIGRAKRRCTPRGIRPRADQLALKGVAS